MAATKIQSLKETKKSLRSFLKIWFQNDTTYNIFLLESKSNCIAKVKKFFQVDLHKKIDEFTKDKRTMSNIAK